MNNNVLKYLILTVYCLIAFSGNILAQNNKQETLEEQDARMAWWKEAKFGMFIHWGLYSIPAGQWGDKTTYGEWIMKNAKISRADYSALANNFNPTKFNAEEWVQLAKTAGQKYIVITAKHHDGFAMFETKTDTYNIVDATPFKRDPLKELAEACRRNNMKLGFYYSQAQDWYHPGGAVRNNEQWDDTQAGDMSKYIEEVAYPQVKEILANYGDIAVLWWDTPAYMTKEMAVKLAELTEPYPNLITNNRLGAEIGGDLETPEQYIPATGYSGRNWEVCMTMNTHWGYNAWDDNWKSTSELIRKLIDIVSKGGNFLLNVGPNEYGVIPKVCQKNLREIGKWLALNGDAVYGTQAGPFPFLSWGRATMKGQKLYLHVFDWPEDGRLVVPFSNQIIRAHLMADPNTDLQVTKGEGKSIISLPSYAPDKIASVIELEYEGTPEVDPIPSNGAVVTASTSAEGSEASFLTDGDSNNRWSAPEGEKMGMLEIDLGEAVDIQCLTVVEPWYPWDHMSQELELQYLAGKEWKSIFTTKTKGTGHTKAFTPLKAQKFRLIVKNEQKPPSLKELILFRAE